LYSAQKSNSHYAPQPYTKQSVFKSLLRYLCHEKQAYIESNSPLRISLRRWGECLYILYATAYELSL